MKELFNKTKSEKGQSLVLFALVIVFLLGLTALVLDFGMVKIAESNMQNAADAAVYAAVENLPDTTAATNAALVYGQLNGADSANITVNTPYNGAADQIEVICTQEVEFTFAQVLGFKSTEVSARAVAIKGSSGGGAFDYALFSGSGFLESQLGSQGYVDGDVHGNNDLHLTGSKTEINGSLESVYNLQLSGGKTIVNGNLQAAHLKYVKQNVTVTGTIQEVSPPFIEMPDLTSVMDAAIANADYVYGGYHGVPDNTTVNGSIYVDGQIGGYGSHIVFQGAVMASGDIQLTGPNIYLPGTDGIALYSANGDIQLESNGADIHGIIYAPNGRVRIGSHSTVHGMIIADSFQLHGSEVSIYYDNSYLDVAGIGGGKTQLIE